MRLNFQPLFDSIFAYADADADAENRSESVVGDKGRKVLQADKAAFFTSSSYRDVGKKQTTWQAGKQASGACFAPRNGEVLPASAYYSSGTRNGRRRGFRLDCVEEG